jgi:hypothetical protein
MLCNNELLSYERPGWKLIQNRVVYQNLSTALIFEDDLGWDIRLVLTSKPSLSHHAGF